MRRRVLRANQTWRIRVAGYRGRPLRFTSEAETALATAEVKMPYGRYLVPTWVLISWLQKQEAPCES